MIFKSLVLRAATAALILLLANGVSFAQTSGRIRFARGKSSAVISERIAGGEKRTYDLSVKKGQRIIVKVRSNNGKVEVDATNFSAGHFEDAGIKSLNLPIEQTGDYQVYLLNNGNAPTRFTLSVTVR